MSSSSTDQKQNLSIVDVTMPQMGVSVAEGTMIEWRKQAGDWVEAHETIGEVSTDKIDTEIPSPATGRVTEILVEVGETVDVGVVLARIATDARPGEPHSSETTAARSPSSSSQRPRRYSPVVQRIAAEHDVDLEHIEGTGRDGRVRKQDVLAHVSESARSPSANARTPAPAASQPSAPAEPAQAPMHIESPYQPDAAEARGGTYEAPVGQRLSHMRRAIGEHMKRSQMTAATCTTWVEVDVSAIERARIALEVTALPLIARCAMGGLREFPALNAWLEGDNHTVHEDVNLGIAVSLGDDGIVVPVIQAAQDLSTEGLARRIKDLARRARTKALRPDDVKGGTFTITNPGQYGSMMATPVINQPQVAILDIEAIIKRPIVVTAADGTDAIAIRPMVVLGLSWDHRALDGVLAARFLGAVKQRMETYEA